MKLIGSTIVGGKVYKGKEYSYIKPFNYVRDGIEFNYKIDLARHLGIKTPMLEKMLDMGYSLDTIWDYLIGDLDAEKCDEISLKLNLDFRVKLEIKEATETESAVYRTFLSINSFSKFLNMSPDSLKRRIDDNWTLEDIVSIPVGSNESKYRRTNMNSKVRFTYKEVEFDSICQFSRYYGFSYQLFKGKELFKVPKEEREAWLTDRLSRRTPDIERQLDVINK